MPPGLDLFWSQWNTEPFCQKLSKTAGRWFWPSASAVWGLKGDKLQFRAWTGMGPPILLETHWVYPYKTPRQVLAFARQKFSPQTVQNGENLMLYLQKFCIEQGLHGLQVVQIFENTFAVNGTTIFYHPTLLQRYQNSALLEEVGSFWTISCNPVLHVMVPHAQHARLEIVETYARLDQGQQSS